MCHVTSVLNELIRGSLSRVDKMFGVKGYCRLDLTVNFHPEHFIDPINCPWVSEDEMTYDLKFLR